MEALRPGECQSAGGARAAAGLADLPRTWQVALATGSALKGVFEPSAALASEVVL